MAKDKKTPKLLSQLAQVFQGYSSDDQHNDNVPLSSAETASASFMSKPSKSTDTQSAIASNAIEATRDNLLDMSRSERYPILQQMSDEPILDSGIKMHLAHALSSSNEDGSIFSIETKEPAYIDVVTELNQAIQNLVREQVTGWSYLASVHGAHYLRPYFENGKGITRIESSYYTLASNIVEFERGGLCAGFTSMNMLSEEKSRQMLAEPWKMVPIKVGASKLRVNSPPHNHTGKEHTLFDDKFNEQILETQNYGSSMLAGCYEPWNDMRDGLRALRGSRENSGRIDRYMTVGMDGLSPLAAAQNMQMVGGQLKKDIQKARNKAERQGIVPTILTSLIPSLAGKGGITVDSQVMPADIQHIEDIMFHLKRACANLGLDVSLLGWGDLMSGGLGDGGFFRTSIQAAIRANEVRDAVTAMILRLVDIHMIFKYGKTFTDKSKIYVKYHSLNTAIEQEKASAMLTRAEHASAVATVLDMIDSRPDAVKRWLMTDSLNMDDELVEKILKDAKQSGDDQQFESIERIKDLARTAAKEEFNSLLSV